MQQVIEQELCETPIPFYIQQAFMRFCKPHWDCGYCRYSPDEEDWEEDQKKGRVCPANMWWHVMQRQKAKQKFDHSHPPTCPYCGERMVPNGTITLIDEDVAAFGCNHCHKIDRSSRYHIEDTRFYLNRIHDNSKTEGVVSKQ